MKASFHYVAQTGLKVFHSSYFHLNNSELTGVWYCFQLGSRIQYFYVCIRVYFKQGRHTGHTHSGKIESQRRMTPIILSGLYALKRL